MFRTDQENYSQWVCRIASKLCESAAQDFALIACKGVCKYRKSIAEAVFPLLILNLATSGTRGSMEITQGQLSSLFTFLLSHSASSEKHQDHPLASPLRSDWINSVVLAEDVQMAHETETKSTDAEVVLLLLKTLDFLRIYHLHIITPSFEERGMSHIAQKHSFILDIDYFEVINRQGI